MAILSASQATQIAKALSDRVRLQTYAEIARRKEVCVGELDVCNLVSRPTLSHHLHVLAEAGLVSSQRSGIYIFYRAIPERMAAYGVYLLSLANPNIVAEEEKLETA